MSSAFGTSGESYRGAKVLFIVSIIMHQISHSLNKYGTLPPFPGFGFLFCICFPNNIDCHTQSQGLSKVQDHCVQTTGKGGLVGKDAWQKKEKEVTEEGGGGEEEGRRAAEGEGGEREE